MSHNPNAGRHNDTNNNLGITAKPHTPLKTITKTPAKFQKDPDKIVGGVAFTRLTVPICFS